ncbi:MAG: DUF1565 domain-containing protein [Crinalium sp.]
MKRQGEAQTSISLQSQVAGKINKTLSLRASLLSALLLISGGTITLTALTQTAPANAVTAGVNSRVIYVNPATGTDSPNAGTSEVAPLRSITSALLMATAGTVVQLAPGSYTANTGEVFPLVVPAGVTLKGNEATKGNGININGGASFVSRIEATQSVTILASNDSVISGVTITNPIIRGTGLWLESSNATVTNNTFVNNKREGIFITGASAAIIDGNKFTQNSGNGITIGRTAKGEIRNNVFENTGFGISLSEEASPLIINNRITKNVDGIVAAYSTAPVLRNNIIESNQRDGIVVVSSAKPDLGTAENPGQNRIRNNGRYDLNNATRSNTLIAYGNDINQKQILGKVDFVGAVIAGNPGSDNSGSTALKDVQGHWAQAYIQNLASQGVIAGFSDGTFRPNQPVTRAQFAAIINKAFAPVPQRNATKFADVSSKSWAAAPIQTAYQGGFLQGYPANKFLPEQAIPKVQVLVSLASGLKLRSDDTSVLSVYSDAKSIPNYALTAVAGATQQELVVNYPIVNQLNPNQQATRAEVAAYVYQALVKSGRASAIPSDYLVKNPLTAQR